MRLSLTLMRFCASTIAALALAVAPASQASEDDEVHLVEEIIRSNAANRERIRTWTGEVEAAYETVRADGSVTSSRRYEVEFLFSRELDATRNVIRAAGPHKFVKPDGTPASIEGDMIVNRMVQDGVMLLMDDLPEGEPLPLRRILTVRQPPRGREPALQFFDPMSYFYQPAKPSIVQTLTVLKPAVGPNSTSPNPLRARVDGERIILETKNLRSINRYVFDRAAACNLVEFLGETDIGEPPKIRFAVNIEYARIGDVFVPSSWKQEFLTRTVKGELLTSIRDITFTRSTLNEPLNAEDMTVEAMGLRIGDTIVDDRTGEQTRYTGTYKPAPRPTTRANESDSASAKKTPDPYDSPELFSSSEPNYCCSVCRRLRSAGGHSSALRALLDARFAPQSDTRIRTTSGIDPSGCFDGRGDRRFCLIPPAQFRWLFCVSGCHEDGGSCPFWPNGSIRERGRSEKGPRQRRSFDRCQARR